MGYPIWIDEFSDALYRNYQNHDVQAHMPFNGWNLYPIFADLWVENIHSAIHKFNASGLKVADHKDKLLNHASVKFKPAEFVLFFKSARSSPETVREIMDFIVLLLNEQNLGDPLWTNNKISAHQDVKAILNAVKPVPANKELAREIGKLITGCATLTHALYNDWCCDVSYDVYGPYDTSRMYGDNTNLLMRSFADLNPVELWSGRSFPVKKVEIYSVYKNVEFQTQLVSCATIAKGSLLDNLINTKIFIDNNPFENKEEVGPFRESILKAASELYAEYMGMGFEKQKELWLSQLSYQFKSLFDFVGQDWRPSSEMISRVALRQLVPTISTYQVSRVEFDEMFGINYVKAAYSA